MIIITIHSVHTTTPQTLLRELIYSYWLDHTNSTFALCLSQLQAYVKNCYATLRFFFSFKLVELSIQYSQLSPNMGISFLEDTVLCETVLEEVYCFEGGWWALWMDGAPQGWVKWARNPWMREILPCAQWASVTKHKPWMFCEAVLEERWL